MRKSCLTALFLMSVVLIPSVTAQAQIRGGGIARDNPLYGLDRALEALQLALTFAPEGKARLKLQLAEERLAEARDLANKGKSDLAAETAKDYNTEMQDAQRFGNEISDLAKKRNVFDLVARATSIHLQVLAEVLAKVPEQAKDAITKAMDASARGNAQAVDALKNSGGVPSDIPKAPEGLPEDVRAKLPNETRPAGRGR